MSNMISVKINKTIHYCPFQWVENDKLTVFYNKKWVEVIRTKEKNNVNGEFIFQIKA